jgi:hypothetical protein
MTSVVSHHHLVMVLTTPRLALDTEGKVISTLVSSDGIRRLRQPVAAPN